MESTKIAMKVLSALPAKNRRKALTHKAPFHKGQEWGTNKSN